MASLKMSGWGLLLSASSEEVSASTRSSTPRLSCRSRARQMAEPHGEAQGDSKQFGTGGRERFNERVQDIGTPIDDDVINILIICTSSGSSSRDIALKQNFRPQDEFTPNDFTSYKRTRCLLMVDYYLP